MIDHLGENGFKIKSHRLIQQAETYVYLSSSKTGAEKGVGMNDDLIIAAGLAFIGINLAISRENCNLLPLTSSSMNFNRPLLTEPVIVHDFNAVGPVGIRTAPSLYQTQEEELNRFTQSLIVPFTDQSAKAVVEKKYKL